MSYTTKTKDSLAALPLKNVCCRKALLLGMLAAKGKMADGMCHLSVEGDVLLSLALSLIREQFGRVGLAEKNPFGTASYTIHFSSRSAEEILTEISYRPLTELLYKRCPDCENAALRGIFLASGRVSDPQKNYHLEFSLGDRREILLGFFGDVGYTPKCSDRRKERLLYFKDNAVIGEVMTRVGATKVAFDYINAMIEKQYRSDASRRANCETRNIARAVDASLKQIECLERLREKNKLTSLPPELLETAKCRLEHRDLSLSQLAASMTPPISKSGLNHRLSKIMDMAKQLLAE